MSYADLTPLFPPGARLRHGIVARALRRQDSAVFVREYANPSTAAAAASRFNRAASTTGFAHTYYSLKNPDSDTGLVFAERKVRVPRG